MTIRLEGEVRARLAELEETMEECRKGALKNPNFALLWPKYCAEMETLKWFLSGAEEGETTP